MRSTQLQVAVPAGVVQALLNRAIQASLDGTHHFDPEAIYTVTISAEQIDVGAEAHIASPELAEEDLSESHRAVLAAVAGGAKRPTEIEAVIGLKHRRVADLLKELVTAGYLIQPQYGRYERAA